MIKTSSIDFFSESEEDQCRKRTELFTPLEKQKILNQLNQERLFRQKNDEMQKKRFENKKIYTIQNKKYYKIMDFKHSYYIKVENYKNISYAQTTVLLYTYTFTTMTVRKGLAKIDKATERILISNDALRIYFKPYILEEEH
ncbi:MAG: hypothetical protein P794_08770 [Epsilonproteobacteria bacterium (ex Lamellibrachia satsuma)]|nr:MAG: hypothetical protein P794_08770 [Epsilonproteobacteria bacterium (ex Lamellibrachia satsuma)]